MSLKLSVEVIGFFCFIEALDDNHYKFMLNDNFKCVKQ